MEELRIYVDGSCSGNPGPGGWGAVLVYGDRKKEISGGLGQTTNQAAEIHAAINGLRAIRRYDLVTKVYSDSAYVVNCMRQRWHEAWKRNGWRNAKGQPVANQELWEELLVQVDKFKSIEFIHVKAHVKFKDMGVNEILNECAHSLAHKATFDPDNK